MILLLPSEFLAIIVISGLTFFGVGLFIYLFLIPIPSVFPSIKSYLSNQRKLKRKSSCITTSTTAEDVDSIYPVVCPPHYGNWVDDWTDKGLKPSMITQGPQGNGWYSAGHWKIDTISDMSEYFASMNNYSASCTQHQEGNLDIEIESSITGSGDHSMSMGMGEDDTGMDYGMMDFDMSTDADMMMMMIF